MSEQAVREVVIVGGGTAGWLTAGVIAAEHRDAHGPTLKITVLESPQVPTIGVGEGTWPSMRDTLRAIGVSETELVRQCDATFKQGSRFARWRRDTAADAYDHPFTLPHGHGEASLVAGWLPHAERVGFAEAVSVQPRLCAAGRAPKQLATPEYAAVANYAYHLDAAKLGAFLQRHCVERLGVVHVRDHMLEVQAHDNGDIAALRTQAHGALRGDLFIDCTGLRALLIGAHYGIGHVCCRQALFNDRALTLQVPYASAQAPIACQTLSTAQRAGWIWDIGLSARRGVGHVYSSAHTSDDEAEATLRGYVAASGGPGEAALATPLRLSLKPGYRRTAWHRNCVAVGLSAGFVEPLEASSLVLVELAAASLSQQMPATRAAMDVLAARFNEAFAYRWQRVVDFLKLHYVLSAREDSDYWRDHRRQDSWTDALRTLLPLWRQQPPSRHDLARADEVFPSASYQYILYGMGFRPDPRPTRRADDPVRAQAAFAEVAELARRMLAALPDHRALVDHIRHHGLSPI